MVDARVLDALAAVPRRLFVPPSYEGSTAADEPFPIGHDQTTSQPSLIALMIEALALGEGANVLEVGTGLGYEAALLSRIAGTVHTVEVVPALAAEAAERLASAGFDNVEVVCANGQAGLAEHAPFDGIVVAAAASHVPEALRDQLADGGRLVLPLKTHLAERAVVYERRGGHVLEVAELCEVRFVPLTGGPGGRRRRGR